jgi:hypothetical protein
MAQRPKPRAKARARSKPHFDDKAQSERFIEAARKLGVEEIGPEFDASLKKILSSTTHTKPRLDET